MRSVLIPDSSPAVMSTNTANRPSTTPTASRFCAGPGDTVEGKNCCSSGTTAWRADISGFCAAPHLSRQLQRCADRCEQLGSAERLREHAGLAFVLHRQPLDGFGVTRDENDRHLGPGSIDLP